MTGVSGWWAGLARFGMRLGLERIDRLMERVGRPEHRFRTLHVAGTNGKGSTAALIAGGLQAAGLRVGLYTSPDLGDVRERVQIDGEPLAPARWSALARVVEEAAQGLPEPPTEFEALTALGFLAFAEAGVDVAVVEVGLGGRYDATNVLPAPLVTVLTPIALDHQQVLGRTLAEIARDKAGVIKPGTVVVSAPQAPPAQEAIRRAVDGAGVRLLWARGRCLWSDASGVTAKVGADVVRTRLLGRHQAVNLATAWTALTVAAEVLGLDREPIREGLESVSWPGRLEVAASAPLVLLDAAHNLHGARALARALTEPHLNRSWHLVFGTLADKPAPAMLRMLLPQVASVVLTRPESPRAMDPAQLAALVPAALKPVVVDTPAEAFAVARQRAGDKGAVLAAGSFYVVAPIRRQLVRPQNG